MNPSSEIFGCRIFHTIWWKAVKQEGSVMIYPIPHCVNVGRTRQKSENKSDIYETSAEFKLTFNFFFLLNKNGAGIISVTSSYFDKLKVIIINKKFQVFL